MRSSNYWLITLIAIALSACGTIAPTDALTTEAPDTCPVTPAPLSAFVPPAPFPAQPPTAYAGQFWYGTPALWTMLGADGSWGGLPKSAGGYSQKVFWWSAGYRASGMPVPALTVSGRRLDGPSDPLLAARATNASADFGEAMLVGVVLPEPGCWEITGNYQGHDLSFVVRVTP